MKQLKGKIVKTLPDTLENSSVYLKKANDVTENRASVDGDKFTMHIVDETGVKKQLTDDTLTLDSVTKRDNTLKEEIKFTPDMEGDVDESVNLGVSRGSGTANKKNIWFTDSYSETADEDVANLTKESVFIGTNLKNVNFTKSYGQYIGNNIGHGISGQSVVVGSYAVNKPENNNVENRFNNVIGLSIADKTSYNLFKQNTIVGYAAFNGSFTTLQKNVVVGTYNNADFDGSNGPLFQTGSYINNVTLGNFNNNFPNSWANVGLGDNSEETDGSNQLPLIKLLSNYDKTQIYNYNAASNLIDSFANSITIGNYNNIVKGTRGHISRSVGSINIGSGNTKGHFRDYFNIYLGNHISSVYQNFANAESYGNIIIGNFLTTWQDKNKLAIHNSCAGAFTKIQDSLIYGDFKDRQLKINGKLTLNPTHHNADGDINYTKQVVAKADGTLGLVNKAKDTGASEMLPQFSRNIELINRVLSDATILDNKEGVGGKSFFNSNYGVKLTPINDVNLETLVSINTPLISKGTKYLTFSFRSAHYAYNGKQRISYKVRLVPNNNTVDIKTVNHNGEITQNNTSAIIHHNIDFRFEDKYVTFILKNLDVNTSFKVEILPVFDGNGLDGNDVDITDVSLMEGTLPRYTVIDDYAEWTAVANKIKPHTPIVKLHKNENSLPEAFRNKLIFVPMVNPEDGMLYYGYNIKSILKINNTSDPRFKLSLYDNDKAISAIDRIDIGWGSYLNLEITVNPTIFKGNLHVDYINMSYRTDFLFDPNATEIKSMEAYLESDLDSPVNLLSAFNATLVMHNNIPYYVVDKSDVRWEYLDLYLGANVEIYKDRSTNLSRITSFPIGYVGIPTPVPANKNVKYYRNLFTV